MIRTVYILVCLFLLPTAAVAQGYPGNKWRADTSRWRLSDTTWRHFRDTTNIAGWGINKTHITDTSYVWSVDSGRVLTAHSEAISLAGKYDTSNPKGYIRGIDTLSLSALIALRMRYSDTASMSARIDDRMRYGDTTGLSLRIDALSAKIPRFYNKAGTLRDVAIKVMTDTFVVNAGNDFTVNISSMGYSTVIGVTACPIKPVSSGYLCPQVHVNSFTNTSVLLDFAQGNNALPVLAVLFPGTIFVTDYTNLKVALTVIGY